MKTFEKVWNLTTKIPKGKVTTYGEIGKKLKINPRVVGFALHANKDQQVPCHRVVNRDGRIAKDYGFGGWKEQKERLESEGIGFVDNMHVNLPLFIFSFDKKNKKL